MRGASVRRFCAEGEQVVDDLAWDAATERAACPEPALRHRGEDRPQLQEVCCGYQVNGGSHQAGPNRATFEHQGGQLLGAEVDDPGPQPDVRGERGLRLHADQVFEHLLGGAACALEQELAGQGRAIQLPGREPLDHGAIVPSRYDTPDPCGAPLSER